MESILYLLILLCVVFTICFAIGIDVVAIGLMVWPYVVAAAGLLFLGYWVYRAGRRIVTGMRFSPGDHVVYIKQKFSTHPGPRAEDVHPARHGDGYSYVVRKPWTVVRVVDKDAVEVVTPGGKHHLIHTDDPHLHRAGIVEQLALWLRWQKRFPEPG
jgi:hypothetical protein